MTTKTQKQKLRDEVKTARNEAWAYYPKHLKDRRYTKKRSKAHQAEHLELEIVLVPVLLIVLGVILVMAGYNNVPIHQAESNAGLVLLTVGGTALVVIGVLNRMLNLRGLKP